jgi:hypothetical protein
MSGKTKKTGYSPRKQKKKQEKKCPAQIFFFITELLVEMLFAKAFIKIENFHRMAK